MEKKMKKLVWIALGLSLTTTSYAWNGGVEDMNTMNDNMSGAAVRVVKSYPGMFRGWSDNAGFRYGGYQFKPHVHHKKSHKSHKHTSHKVKRHHRKHAHVKSGVCIAKCYCEHK